jgi:tryptophanase
MSFFAELKRRNVFRVGAAYVAVSWLTIQVVETLFSFIDVFKRRDTIRGLKMVYEPYYLRFFQARFKPLS